MWIAPPVRSLVGTFNEAFPPAAQLRITDPKTLIINVNITIPILIIYSPYLHYISHY
uniref:Uncharacterized protein n=1 Tax=Borrelia turicatae (strain 91E135) TaxID=314724 RepID=S4VUG2_BORT9|nr:hypothetical protein BTA023 [Borrelia turicatae 91E135]